MQNNEEKESEIINPTTIYVKNPKKNNAPINSNDRETINDIKTENDELNNMQLTNQNDYRTNTVTELKNKNKKLLYLIIIPLIIILTGIIIIVCTFGLKKDKNSKNENEDNIIDEEKFYSNSGEEIVVNIKRKVNQVYQYQEIDETSKIYNIEEENTKRRRLNQEIIKSKINYGLNIYKEEELSDKSILYSAYAIILIKVKIDENDEIYEGGKNIFDPFFDKEMEEMKKEIENEENNEENNIELNEENIFLNEKKEYDIPIIKIKFYDNGTLYEIKKPENINENMFSYLRTFIDKVIPSVSKSLYSNNKLRNLQNKKIERNYKRENNKTKLNENRNHGLSLTTINLDGSLLNSNKSIEVDSDGNIKNVEMKQNTLMSSEGKIENENFEDSILNQEDFDDEIDNFQSFPIKSISSTTISKVDLIETNINETVSKELNELISNINFINVNLESLNNDKRRLLELLNLKDKKIFEDNLKNYITIKGNNIRKLDIQNFEQPIRFKYPVFKSNIVGVKVTMNAAISYFPRNGTVHFQLIYKVDETSIIIFDYSKDSNIQIPYEKFRLLVNNINLQLVNLTNYIKIESSKWKKNIQIELKNISNFVNGLYDATSIFIEPLNNLMNDIKDFSKDTFDKVYTEINKCDYNLLSLQSEIDNKSEEYQNILISESKSTFSNSINDYYEKIELLNTFANELIDNLLITDRTGIDIGTYYNIIDQLNSTEKLYNEFESMLKNAINQQSSLLKNFSYELFKNNLLNIIEKEEFISKRLQTNQTLIEAINNKKRTSMISSLNAIRNKVIKLIDSVLSNINNIYSSLLNGSELSLILNDIQNKKNSFITKKNNIISTLREEIDLTSNFEIYINHINLLFDIDKTIINLRNEKFFENIITPLDNIKTDFITSNDFDDINEIINSIVSEVSNNKENEFSNLPLLLEQLNSNIDSSITNTLSNNLITKIYNKYNNNSFFDTQLKLYYTPIIKAFNEYNITFYEKMFKNDYEQYVDRPKELFIKLDQLITEQKSKTTKMINLISTALQDKINQKLTETYQLYINQINQYLTNIQIYIPKEDYSGNSLSNINLIKSTFDLLLTKINENKELSLNISYQKEVMNIENEEDSFELSKYIKSNEDSMSKLLTHIRKYIQIDFEMHFCDGISDICDAEKIGKLDDFSIYNYQTAKLRAGISKFYEMISNFQNSESFNLLSVNDYVNIFKDNTDYKKDYIANEILNYLKEINDYDINLINPTIISIKDNLTKSFENNINQGLIQSNINKLAIKIFEIPITFKSTYTKIKNAFDRNVTNIFSELYKNYSNIDIFIERNKLEESYTLLKNSVNSILSEDIEYINNFVIDENLINTVIEYYLNEIKKIGLNFYETLSKISNFFSEYELIDLTFSLNKISNETYNEEFEKLKQIITEEINKQFTEYFNKQKSELVSIMTNYNEKIIEYIKEKYEDLFNKLTEKGKNEEGENITTITSLSDELIEKVENCSKIVLESIKNIYNQQDLNKNYNVNSNSNIEILNIPTPYIFPEINEKIWLSSQTLSNFCDDRLLKEKILFKEKIENIIENGYNLTITEFSSSYGHSYLTQILKEISLFKIQQNLNNIENIIQMNHEYLKLIINESLNIQELIKDVLINIYNTISETISTNLNNDMEITLNNIISIFKEETNNQITNLFTNYIISTLHDNNFKKSFTQNIIDLFPKEFTDGYINKLNNNYNELTESNNLGDFKSSTITQLNNAKINFVNTLNSFKEEMNGIVSLLTIIQISDDLKYNVLLHLTNYQNNYNEYPKSFEFSLSDSSKEAMTNLINNKIYEIIYPIVNSYTEKDDLIKNKLTERISLFGDYVTEVKTNSNSNNIIDKTTNSFNSLIEIKDNIKNYIFGQIEEFKERFEKELKKKYKDESRILESENIEFNIKNILSNIEKIKTTLETISKEIQITNEYLNISKQYSMFETEMKNMINNIESPIDNTLENIFDYLTEEQYTSFSTNLINQSKEIINFLQEYSNKESQLIYNSIDLIKNGIPLIYSTNYNEIKNKIDNYLIFYSDKFFNNEIIELNDIKEEIQGTEKLTLGQFTENMNGHNIRFSATIPSYTYSYLFKMKYENYEIYTEASLTASSNIDVSYNSGAVYSRLRGTIGSGKMGLIKNDYLKDYSVFLNAYQNTLASSYNKYYQYTYTRKECSCFKTWCCKTKTYYDISDRNYKTQASEYNAIKYY